MFTVYLSGGSTVVGIVCMQKAGKHNEVQFISDFNYFVSNKSFCTHKLLSNGDKSWHPNPAQVQF